MSRRRQRRDEIKKEKQLKENNNINNSIDNLLQLNDLQENTFIQVLRSRYENNIIYTYVGPILIALNPYKEINLLYNDKNMLLYHGQLMNKLPPHVFAIAEAAYHELIHNTLNQSIIISGESGAGKTETTKFIMQYLVRITSCKNDIGTLEEKVLDSNPLLESFGNAKTLRNDNSSRFGKFIEIQFNNQGKIEGAKVMNFLLEKTRIVTQNLKERNYHIFYELLAGADPVLLNKLYLSNNPLLYNYLNKTQCYLLKSRNDKLEFEKTIHCMKTLGMTIELQNKVFLLLATILHLGNLNFIIENNDNNNDSCTIENTYITDSFTFITKDNNNNNNNNKLLLDIIANNLGVDNIKLKNALCTKQLYVNGKIIIRPQNINQAADKRDALAKSLYSCLFIYLIKILNQTIQSSNSINDNNNNNNRLLYDDYNMEFMNNELDHDIDPDPFHSNQSIKQFIGVLDIYGFEKFDINSFEQLCINYANEKLQEHFNKEMLDIEQEIYNKEGIEWNHIDYNDNKECLDLLESKIDGKPGIFITLDDVWRLKNDLADKKFVSQLHINFGNNTNINNYYIQPRMDNTIRFGIKHYAGEVIYDATGFNDKNNEDLNEDIKNVIKESNDEWLKSIFIFPNTNISTNLNIPPPLSRRPSEQSNNSNNSNTNNIINQTNSNNNNNNNNKLREISIGNQFRNQLADLMDRLKNTHSWYIRCIKPNNYKKPDNINNNDVINQLKYSGMFEAISIRQKGFALREDHDIFYDDYIILYPESNTIQELLYNLSNILHINNKSKNKNELPFQLGKTKVFLKLDFANKIKILARLRTIFSCRTILYYYKYYKKYKSVIKIQKIVKGYLVRKDKIIKYQSINKIISILKTYIKKKKYIILLNKKKKELKSIITIQKIWRGVLTRYNLKNPPSKYEKYTPEELDKEIITMNNILQEALNNKNYTKCSEYQEIIELVTTIRKKKKTRKDIELEIKNNEKLLIQYKNNKKFDKCAEIQLILTNLSDKLLLNYYPENWQLMNATELDKKYIYYNNLLKNQIKLKNFAKCDIINKYIVDITKEREKKSTKKELTDKLEILNNKLNTYLNNKDFVMCSEIQENINNLNEQIKNIPHEDDDNVNDLNNNNITTDIPKIINHPQTKSIQSTSLSETSYEPIHPDVQNNIPLSSTNNNNNNQINNDNNIKQTVATLRPSKPVIVHGHMTAYEVAVIMKEKRTDAALVINNKHNNEIMIGIITDTDFLRRIIGPQLDPKKIQIQQVMTKDPFFVYDNDNKMDALNIMIKKRFRHLPVLKKNLNSTDTSNNNRDVISGILNFSKAFFDRLNYLEKNIPYNSSFFSLFIKDVIKNHNITNDSIFTSLCLVYTNTIVSEAAKEMTIKKKPCLVLNNSTNKLCGIFTPKDIVTRVIAQGFHPELTSVEKVMTWNPDTAFPDTLLYEALKIMQEGKFFSLPIITNENDTTNLNSNESNVYGIIDIFTMNEASFNNTNTANSKQNEKLSFWMDTHLDKSDGTQAIDAIEDQDEISLALNSSNKQTINDETSSLYSRRSIYSDQRLTSHIDTTKDITLSNDKIAVSNTFQINIPLNKKDDKLSPRSHLDHIPVSNSHKSNTNGRLVSKLRMSAVVLANENDTVLTATLQMIEANVDAILITNNSNIIGILTDTDINKKVVARELYPDRTLLKNVMTRDPFFVYSSDNSNKALLLMTLKKIRHLPVLDKTNNTILGMLHIGRCIIDCLVSIQLSHNNDKMNMNPFEQKSLYDIYLCTNSRCGRLTCTSTALQAACMIEQTGKPVLIYDNSIQNKFLGIFTANDLLEKVVSKNLNFYNTLLSDNVINKKPIMVQSNIDIIEALHKMQDHSCQYLAVIHGDNNNIIDIIDILSLISNCFQDKKEEKWEQFFNIYNYNNANNTINFNNNKYKDEDNISLHSFRSLSSISHNYHSNHSKINNNIHNNIHNNIDQSQIANNHDSTVNQVGYSNATLIFDKSTIMEASFLMKKENTDALLVVNSNNILVGIITDNDITKRGIACHLNITETKVFELMTKNPKYVNSTEKASEALILMTNNKFRHLPVIKNDDNSCTIVGMLQIHRCLYETIERLRTQQKNIIEQKAHNLLADQLSSFEQIEPILEKLVSPTIRMVLDGNNGNHYIKMPSLLKENATVLEASIHIKATNQAILVVANDNNNPGLLHRNRLIGLVSPKDILLKLVSNGLNPEYTSVSNIMEKNPKCVSSGTTVLEALQIMYQQNILYLPIIDNNNIVGLLDILSLVSNVFSQSADWKRFWQMSFQIRQPQVAATVHNDKKTNNPPISNTIANDKKVYHLRPSKVLILPELITVAEAAKRMKKFRTDAAIITTTDSYNNNHNTHNNSSSETYHVILGILTDNDIINRVLSKDIDPMALSVANVMTNNPKIINSNENASTALNTMIEGRFRHLPVINSNTENGMTVTGMLDISKCLYDAVDVLNKSNSNNNLNHLLGNDHSLDSFLKNRSSKPIIINKNTSVKEMSKLIAQTKQALLVVDIDNNDKELLGVVTSKDLLYKVVASKRSHDSLVAEDIMNENPAIVQINQTITDVVHAMYEHKESFIPIIDVTNNDNIEGLVHVYSLLFDHNNRQTNGSNNTNHTQWDTFWKTALALQDTNCTIHTNTRNFLNDTFTNTNEDDDEYERMSIGTIEEFERIEKYKSNRNSIKSIDQNNNVDVSKSSIPNRSYQYSSSNVSIHKNNNINSNNNNNRLSPPSSIIASSIATSSTAINNSNNNKQDTFVFKIEYENRKYHRLRTQYKNYNLFIKDINKKLKLKTNLDNEINQDNDFTITYKDDEGDKAMIHSDETLLEAVEMAKHMSWKSLILEIILNDTIDNSLNKINSKSMENDKQNNKDYSKMNYKSKIFNNKKTFIAGAVASVVLTGAIILTTLIRNKKR